MLCNKSEYFKSLSKKKLIDQISSRQMKQELKKWMLLQAKKCGNLSNVYFATQGK